MTTAKTIAAQGTVIKIGNGESPEVFATIGEVRTFTGPGGSAAVIDTTTLESTRREKRMGLPDEGQFTLDVNLDPTDTDGQIACRTARTNRTLKNFEVTYPNSSKDEFSGYVTGFQTSGAVDANIEATITIEITGAVTFTP